MNLQYNSSNLVQRYTMMVMFYNLSGENWKNDHGFGSGQHECKWFRIRCNFKNEVQEIVWNDNQSRGSISIEIEQFSIFRSSVIYSCSVQLIKYTRR